MKCKITKKQLNWIEKNSILVKIDFSPLPTVMLFKFQKDVSDEYIKETIIKMISWAISEWEVFIEE